MSLLDGEAQRRLALAREEIRAAVEGAAAECAEAIAAQARADCPVVSRRLRESIGSEVVVDPSGMVVEARVFAAAPYAAAVELGLGENPPQPFLLPAVERHGLALRDALRRAAGPIRRARGGPGFSPSQGEIGRG